MQWVGRTAICNQIRMLGNTHAPALGPVIVGRVVSGRGDSGVGMGESTGGRLTRIGSPMDIAYAAAWLASDEAAFVTGDLIAADGGAHINGDVLMGS